MEFICLYILTFAAIIYIAKTLKPLFFKKKKEDELRLYVLKTVFDNKKIEPKIPMTKAKSKKTVVKTSKKGK